MDVKDHPSSKPAARGRIIKKGDGPGIRGSGAAVVTPSRSVSTPASPAHVSQSTSWYPAGRARDCLASFVLVPALFAASAGFMCTRPVDESTKQVEHADTAIHARYEHIGHEITGRFASNPSGVVISPPQRRAITAAVPAVTSGLPVSVKASQSGKSQDELEALEKQVYRVLKRHGRPVQNGRELATSVVREALAQSYDPVFVAAVIKSESAFNALARSHKGAQGLMQIMPKTGAWLADQASIPRQKLTDPGHNLKLGISYLKQLEQEYNGNRMLALVAYNWGPGHVASASTGRRRIPGEVMQYAIKILNDYRRWSSEMRSSVG